MGSNQYQRGRRFEYEVKKHLEGKGWMVFRTAGSHGLADLIAVRRNNTLLVQCKYGTMPSKKERKKLFEAHWSLFGDNIFAIFAIRKVREPLEFFVMTSEDEKQLFCITDW